MTTAKSQQMVGQTDSADDLIAELARLMAQDTVGNAAPAPRPAPIVQPAPSSPVRIPGMQAPQPAPADDVSPVPRFQFDAAPAAAASAAPAPAPAPQAAAPQKAAEPDPFSFDFGLNTARREPAPARVEPAPRAVQPTPQQAAPAQVAAPIPAPVIQQPVAPAPVAADAHDTIADLITAELSQSAPAPVADVPAPQPAPEPVQVARPAPEAAIPLRSAATVAPRGDHVEPARSTLRPVNLTPIAKPESDKFRIAPVFGLGTNPPAAANNAEPVRSEARPVEPQAPVVASPPAPVRQEAVRQEPVLAAPEPVKSNDPIQDIESLIGRAVRVNVDQAAERPAPSPALRSLATPTLVTPTNVPTEKMVASADDAILAAAAATGAEVGWVNPADAKPARKAAKPAKQPKVKAPKAAPSGLMRAFLGPVVAICLLLVAGFGLYWVLGLGNTGGPAPVLVADTSPIKQVAAAQPDAGAAQQSVVFNEIEGVEPGANEQLVSRDQADVNEVTRIVTPDVNSDGVANRKVRTVTVRPDGSIVSGDDAVAGAAMLPVDRPAVPEVPGAQTASPELLASASALQTPAATPAPVAPEPVAPAVIPVVPGSNVPVVDATGNTIAGRTAPVPFQRPASVGNAAPSQATPVNAVVDPVGAILQPTAQTTVQAATGQSPQVAVAAPAPAPAAAAPVTNAAAYAQLASQRSEADAQATLDVLNRRYGLLFNGAQLQIQRADLGERGVYYRVILPTSSRELAADLCSSVKSNGDDCLVM